MNHRRNNIQDAAGDAQSGWTVNAYQGGAYVRTTQSSSTINVQTGHGFAAGDKILYLVAGVWTYSGVDDVQSTTSNTVVMGQSYSVTVGDVIFNLGPDAGVATPDYDQSSVSIYNEPSGTTSALTDSAVTTNSDGEYSYYFSSADVWEIARDSSLVVQDIHPFIPTGGLTGPSSSTDNAIVRWSGTGGDTIQDYTSNAPTVSDAGDMTIDGDLSADNLDGALVTSDKLHIFTDTGNGTQVVMDLRSGPASPANNDGVAIQSRVRGSAYFCTRLTMRATDVTPGAVDGQFVFYCVSNGSGLTERMRLDHDGDLEVTGVGVTTDGRLNADGAATLGSTCAVTGAITGPNVSSGDDPGHSHATTINVPLPVSATGVVEGVMFMNLGNGSLTLISAQLNVFTPPSGGTVVCDIYEHQVGVDTDPGTAGSTVFITNTAPTVADGKYTSPLVTLSGSDDATLEVGYAWTFDVTTLTSPAAGLVLTLNVRRS